MKKGFEDVGKNWEGVLSHLRTVWEFFKFLIFENVSKGLSLWL